MKITRGAIIRRPMQEVFDYVADMTNDPHWAPMVEGATQIEGDGPGVGAAWEIQQRVGKGTRPMVMRMTAHDRPALLSWEMETKRVKYRSSMAFAPHVKGTAIRQTTIQTWDVAWWLKLLGPFIAARSMRLQFKGLRRELEREE